MNQEDRASRELRIRPVSHNIRVKFFLEEGRLAATDEVHLQRMTDTWDDVRFVLWHQLEIDEILIDGQPARFTYGGGERYREVIVRKEELPGTRKCVHLIISYAGKLFYEREGVLRATINPEIASLNPSFFPWYPHFNTSIDSAADMTFVVPKEYTVVASGELVDVTSCGDWKEWTWHTDISGERSSFAIARYESRSICVDDIPVSVYVFAEDAHEMDALLEEASSIFRFCSERLGKYPLEKFAIAALPDSIIGGYGEESFIKWQRRLLEGITKSGPFAHEIAHTWVLRATSARGGLWLLESLGEYVSHLYQEVTKGTDIARNVRAFWAIRYFDVVSSRISDYPLIDYHEDMSMDHYLLYYNKGAWIWHILRQVLGDEAFDKVILELHRRYLLKHVTVDDFRAICREIVGESLSWFFEEWLGRPGVPMLELTDIVTTSLDDGFLTTGTLQQQGDIYRLPVEMGIQMEGQREVHRIWIESAETRFEFKTNERPGGLVLDPNTNLLRAPGLDESVETVYDTGRVVPIGRAAYYVIADNDAEVEILKRTT